MTANEFIRKLQEQVGNLSSGEVPIKFDGHTFVDAEVKIDEGPDGYYINITPIYF